MFQKIQALGAGDEPPSGPAIGSISLPKRIPQGTEQQEKLWSSLTDDDSHLIAEARAGCGKTASCREGMFRMLAERPGLRIRYAVFSKANADEMRPTTPPGVEVGTMHSFGFAALREAYHSNVERNKTYLILDEDRRGRSLPRFIRKSIWYLVGQAKNQAVAVPPDEQRNPSEFDAYADALEPLLDHYAINSYGRPQMVCEWATRVLARSADWPEVIDFDDMIWLPTALRLSATRLSLDALFIDECQDLNPAQHGMIELLSGGGRVIAVGDRHQALYAFRGADVRSIPRLVERLGSDDAGVAIRPLTATFRCPRSHVLLAREYVSDITAAPGNAEGVVEDKIPLDLLPQLLKPGDLAICPNNAPVVTVALRLLAQRRRAVVRGRAIGDSLIQILRTAADAKTIGEVTKGVESWKGRELGRLADLDGAEDAVESTLDRASGLHAIVSACAQPSEVEPLILDLFREDADRTGTAVNLSTVHRAKGLEADRVFFIDTPMRDPQTDWEVEQQHNLRYVALTRSKHYLAFVSEQPPLSRT